jgi:hypothetical protein
MRRKGLAMCGMHRGVMLHAGRVARAEEVPGAVHLRRRAMGHHQKPVSLDGGSRPPVALPADLAAAYRQEVDQLNGSTDGADGTETRELIRSLIERVIITPMPDGKASEVELVGEIAAMINLAVNATRPGKQKLSRAMRDSFTSSVQVVAGTGFEPVTFRL